MDTDKIIFDITHENYSMIAEDYGNGDSTITIFKDNDVVAEFACWTYKVWNYPAHFVDIIADLEDGLDKASA